MECLASTIASRGWLGAALDREDLSAELILDGIHVHPAAARIAVRAKGTGQIILVTDATQAAGLGDGTYIRPETARSSSKMAQPGSKRARWPAASSP